MSEIRKNLRKVAAGAACLAEREEAVIAVEPETISKNGASSKSQMSRKNFINKIKMKSNVLLIIGLPFLIASCSPQLAVVKSEAKRNDITITSDMKQFSKENRNPSIVLRVPYVTSSVSEAEQKRLSKYNDVYNQIEKNLLKAGFKVRDRGLLNNILSTGQSNYAEIGKKIETDVIIEILNIDFDIDNYVHKAILKKSNNEIAVAAKQLNPKIAKIECKLTIVDKGLTGGLLTLYYTPCTNGCEFLFSWDFQQVTFVGRDVWYSNIYWSAEYDQATLENTIAYFSNIIATILRGNTGYVGFGWKIDPMKNLPEITSIVKGTPAEDVGFQVGDVILKINGESTLNKTEEELNNLLWGEAGVRTNFTIKRGNSEFEKTVTKINRF